MRKEASTVIPPRGKDVGIKGQKSLKALDKNPHMCYNNHDFNVFLHFFPRCRERILYYG